VFFAKLSGIGCELEKLFLTNIPTRSFIWFKAALMSTVYEEQKDEDGFLYVNYSGETTFGEWEQV